MTTILRARPGIALVAALGLMTLIGLMIAGAFAASMLGEQSSRLTKSDAMLATSADYAVATILGDPRGYGLADLPLGQPRSFDVTNPDAPTVRATVSVTRLPAAVLWFVVDATIAGVDQGHRRINVVARFPSLATLPAAPIVAHGNVVARNSVSFGADTSGDADCTDANALDVVTSSDATASVATGARAGVLPSAADSSTYYMKAYQRAMLDSSSAVVHVRGDTTIAGGTFSGILLVDGSLTVTGPFNATGLVVARGWIKAIAGGFSLSGAAMAYGSPLRDTTAVEIAHATVQYAPCAIANALRHAVRPRPVRQRGWAELF
jgi:hypothetical protein